MGFMVDEANASWVPVCIVCFGGAKKKKGDKERSCVFHWEQTLLDTSQNAATLYFKRNIS